MYIQPLHKSGDVHNIRNYRHISIFSCFAKVLDAILDKQLADIVFLKLSQNQHEFVRGRFTYEPLGAQ